MNRRRFLKYAGATAALVGASALGLDYILRTHPLVSNQTSITSIGTTASSTITSTHTTDLKLTLFADWHGDGMQQPDEAAINNIEIEIAGLDNEYKAVLGPESDGSYWARNIPVGKKYQVIPKSDKFGYVAISNSQFVATKDYSFVVGSPELTLHLGLMDGFLTLPVRPGTKYEIDRFYDRDPDSDKYLWWNGTHGYDRGLKRGYSPNHTGIDYHMEEGNPLPSPAPGKVWALGEATGCPDWRICDEGEKYVNILHSNGFITSCNHISNSLVNLGDQVRRGQIIALSGKSGKNTEQANYPHNHFGFSYRGLMILDPYRPTFQMIPKNSGYYDAGNGNWITSPIESSPNMANHWTKDNDPQYSTSAS